MGLVGYIRALRCAESVEEFSGTWIEKSSGWEGMIVGVIRCREDNFVVKITIFITMVLFTKIIIIYSKSVLFI